MERTRGIEPPSQPWQGRILTIKPHSHLEGPTGFEPVIRVLQTHALATWLRFRAFRLYQIIFDNSIKNTIKFDNALKITYIYTEMENIWK